jgi:dihydrofolate reductase
MKKIKLYIAASLDGYIARPDDDLDWLTKYPVTPELNYGYDEFYASVDTVIMGGRTYRELLCMDVLWPYKDKKTYVISRHSMETKENIEFITENVIERISGLRGESGKDIWLAGGGELISILLAADLIDEMQICHIPVILGEGIPLFPGKHKESQWELTGNTAFDSGILTVDYKRVNR